MVAFGWNVLLVWTKRFEKLVMSPVDGVCVVITTAGTIERTQCYIRKQVVFRMCTSVCYEMDIASACVCLMNSWRLALCPSVTIPLKKRGTSPSDAKLWPAAYIVTVWRHCMAKTYVYSAPHPGTLSVKEPPAKDIPQDPSTFSQQRSAFPLSRPLSSWIKQGTSSDVSTTSANFVVQPRLLRRFAGGLCWTQTDVGQWYIIAQRWPTGRQADSPIPSPRRRVIRSCGRVAQQRALCVHTFRNTKAYDLLKINNKSNVVLSFVA
jgi:hypothetical protein